MIKKTLSNNGRRREATRGGTGTVPREAVPLVVASCAWDLVTERFMGVISRGLWAVHRQQSLDVQQVDELFAEVA